MESTVTSLSQDRKDWFKEKPNQLAGDENLSAFGVKLGIRDGSAQRLIEQLQFTELLAELGVAHFVESVYWCHKGWCHNIFPIKNLHIDLCEIVKDAARRTLNAWVLHPGGYYDTRDASLNPDHQARRSQAIEIQPMHPALRSIRGLGALLCPCCGTSSLMMLGKSITSEQVMGPGGHEVVSIQLHCHACGGSPALWVAESRSEGGDGVPDVFIGWMPFATPVGALGQSPLLD